MMDIVSIVGARPQFIKAAAVSRMIRQQHHELLVHTGQHYDYGMSQVFFDELNMPHADINLGIGSGAHGEQTGAMLAQIEALLQNHTADWVLVYGDTNSTLAGALAAAKLHIPVAHVEAGLRSFNRAMPEEINRVVADHLSSLLLCPSQTAIDNLAHEGITNGVHLVGDVMADALALAANQAHSHAGVMHRLGVQAGQFVLTTVHRAENTDTPGRLQAILQALLDMNEAIVFPVHPRTRNRIAHLDAAFQQRLAASQIQMIEPVGYLEMVALEQSARMILTDSGGIQKEAYWLGIPCITLRDETEWIETVQHGWNIVVGADTARIVEAARHWTPPTTRPPLYGEGEAVQQCIARLEHAHRDSGR